MEYSNIMDDTYDNINYYNTKRNRKILIVFDDMIADMNAIKKFRSIGKELFIRCRKLRASLLFITRYFFSCAKRRQIKLYALPNKEDSI